MTTPVVTVDLRTRHKQIAALLTQHQISAMPGAASQPARQATLPG
jgi:hypothetical protein